LKFLAPNIQRTGRILRAIWGVLMSVGGGLAARQWGWWAGAPLFAIAIFSFFEAVRGWCFVRACGIKTRY
jgi:hypothetical protein